MLTISIATIVKNEAHNIEAFLSSIGPLADELVIVDTGSTDGTLALLKKYAAASAFPIHVFELSLEHFHYGKAKNQAIERATGDYVFVLDADERISEQLAKNLKQFLKEKNPTVVSMPRQDELVPHFIEMQTRLFKNNRGVRYGDDDQSLVHEQLLFSGEAMPLDAPILHVKGKDHWLHRPSRMYPQLAMDVERTPRTRGRFNELAHAPIGFFYKFRQTYVWRNTYKDGWHGFKYALFKGWYAFLFHVQIAMKPR